MELACRANIRIFISKQHQIINKFMNFDYIKAATEVIQKNTPQAIQSFEKLLSDKQHIEKLLQLGKNNQTVLFVTVEMLSKIILRGQFLAVQQSRSDDGQSEKSQQLQRIRIYSNIMSKVYQIAMTQAMADYLDRSCINLVSLCLKNIFDKTVAVKLNFFTIQEYIGVLLPGFQITENFTTNFNNQIVVIEPKIQNVPQGFSKAMKAFTSMLEYVTFNAYFKSYYDFRRNIYTFRNSNLPILLNIAIQYSKHLLNICVANNWNINQFLIYNLSNALSFLDTVFMFPFTLSLHQYDHELEPNDKITGNNGQIYFPQYFRNVLCDTVFIHNLGLYYRFLSAVDKPQSLPDLKKILRIMGRMSSASGYCFNKDQQKKIFRNSAVEFAITLATECKFQDPYFLNSIAQVIQKILSTYSCQDYGELKKQFLEAALKFAHLLVTNSKIVLSEGKKNPYSAGFQIICTLLSQTLETQEEAIIKQVSQQILQKGLNRLCNNEQIESIIKQFGYQNPTEIECFQQLFTFIAAPFQQSQQKNLAILYSLNFQNLGRASRITWLHLGALLLPSHQAKVEHTKLILKFYDIAKQTQGIASLYYTHTLVTQIMFQMEQGISTTTLWLSIEELLGETFNTFLMNVLQKCFSNFTIPDQVLLDYTLEVFSSIYTKLKKNDKPHFERFYNLVNDILININKTVLSQPKFFKKRVAFFNVISVIWINQTSFKYTYQIYQLLLKQMKQADSLINFLKFMCDMAGLLQPIECHQNFQILADLLLEDLKKLLPYYLGPNSIEKAFSEPHFLKAFIKLVLALCDDSYRRVTRDTHATLPIEIHKLFYPYLCEVIKYDFPRITVKLWQKFITLTPVGEILPLTKSFTQANSTDYPLLIRQYFQNINRCTQKQLEGLYDYIEGSVEFMCEWWEQIMARNLKPSINMKDVAEARIWQTRRQKQMFAKLLFCIGRYNPPYWRIAQGSDERTFVNLFMQEYQG